MYITTPVSTLLVNKKYVYPIFFICTHSHTYIQCGNAYILEGQGNILHSMVPDDFYERSAMKFGDSMSEAMV